MLISVCYLVIKGLLQTNSDGSTKLMDFLDEQRMHAFSYASIGGKVTMTLAQEEPYIRLRVYNTGAPIDQKDLPHL